MLMVKRQWVCIHQEQESFKTSLGGVFGAIKQASHARLYLAGRKEDGTGKG